MEALFPNSENHNMDVKASPPPSNIISSAIAKTDLKASNEKLPVADANWQEGASRAPQPRSSNVACRLLNHTGVGTALFVLGAVGSAVIEVKNGRRACT
jgi:hypothetical protein